MTTDTHIQFLLVILAVPALFILHRLGQWAEMKGWIYYSKNRDRKSSGVGNAMAELEALFRPQARQVIQVREKTGAAKAPRRKSDSI